MNDLVQNKTFEERMRERIREDIGKLLTDEELSTMIKKCIDDIFFKPRKNDYGKDEPPLLYEIVRELLEPTVLQIAKEYINANQNEVIKVIKDTVTMGMGTALIKSFNEVFRIDEYRLQNEIIERIKNGY